MKVKRRHHKQLLSCQDNAACSRSDIMISRAPLQEWFWVINRGQGRESKLNDWWAFVLCLCSGSHPTCSFQEPPATARWTACASTFLDSPQLPFSIWSLVDSANAQHQERTSTCLSQPVFSPGCIYFYIISCCSTQLVCCCFPFAVMLTAVVFVFIFF